MLPILLSTLLIVPHLSYTPDDTYIHLQFARNLLRGEGFSFNRGEPTYGSTSPLWVFLLTLGGLFTRDLLAVSKILSLCFTLGSIVLFAFLMRSFFQAAVYIWAGTLTWSLDAWLLRWAPSGMETSCALFMLLISLLFYVKERTSHQKMFVSSGLCGVLTIVRPEGLLLFLLFLVDKALVVKQRLRTLLFFVLPYLCLLVPWLIYAYLQFGRLVPNTFAAKGLSPSVGFGEWMHSLTSACTFVLSNRLWETLLLLGGGLAIAWTYRCKRERSGKSGPGYFIFVAWIVILPVAYILKGLPIVSRYLLLITPPLILCGFSSLQRIFDSLRIRDGIRKWLVLIIVMLSVTQNMIVSVKVVHPHLRHFTAGMRECFIPIGEWFAEHTPPGTTIAALDIGALGYVSDRRIVDLGGLVTPEVLPLLKHYHPEELADRYPYVKLSIPRAEYIVYRSKDPDGPVALKGVYEALYRKHVASLGITADPGETYYTVCRIRWDELQTGKE